MMGTLDFRSINDGVGYGESGPENKIKFVRKMNETTVLAATPTLLKRPDMFPCDAKGTILETAEDFERAAKQSQKLYDRCEKARARAARARQAVLGDKSLDDWGAAVKREVKKRTEPWKIFKYTTAGPEKPAPNQILADLQRETDDWLAGISI